MSNLLDKISELEQQLAALRAEAEEEENKDKGKRWRARNKSEYYYVDTTCGVVISEEDDNLQQDTYRYDTHNYFQTEEEAREYDHVLETERQLKKFADEYNDEIDWENTEGKWSLYYDYAYHRISIIKLRATKDARVIYFSSKEIVQQAVDAIGPENIEEYLTYEW